MRLSLVTGRRARQRARSTSSQITCSSVRWTSWTRGGRLGRHVDVNRRRPRPTAPPSRPVSAIVRSAAPRAASSAASDVRPIAPLVLMPSATSPAPAERLDLPREHPVEPVVVGDARQHARVGRQRDRRQRRAARAGTGRRARPRRAARRRRCRRCRTRSSLPPPRERRDDRRRRAARPAADRRPRTRSCSAMASPKRPRSRSRSRQPRDSRSFATFARNSSSVTCIGSVVRGVISICTG